MDEFSYEIFAAILVFVFVGLLALEYLWLFLASRKNEDIIRTKQEIELKVKAMLEALLYAGTEQAAKSEFDALFDYVGDVPERKDALAQRFTYLMSRSEDIPDSKHSILEKVCERLDPIGFYYERLQNGGIYVKCYSVRRLADFNATDKVEEIRKLLNEKKSELCYNAAMALSDLGDEDGVLIFAKNCQRNRKYSHRVLLELFQTYSGDREKLVRDVFAQCDNYIKSTVVKAYTADNIQSLADLYLEGMNSDDENLKIASVKAIAGLGNPEYEHKMNIALNNKNWIIRLAAVKGLEKIATQSALESLVHATQDEEWWVRNAAAQAIVKIDYYLTYVEKVLSGYDKYAADAVKSALYKQIDISGGAFR